MIFVKHTALLTHYIKHWPARMQ